MQKINLFVVWTCRKKSIKLEVLSFYLLKQKNNIQVLFTWKAKQNCYQMEIG